MSFVIPRKKEFWLRRPTGAVELNWSDWSAEGLSLATVFDGSNRELVEGRDISLFGDTFVDNAVGASFDESGDYLTIPSVVLDSSFSVTSAPQFADNAGNAFQYWFSFGPVATANSLNMALVEESDGNAPNKVKIFGNNSNEPPTLVVDNAYPSVSGQTQTFVCDDGAGVL